MAELARGSVADRPWGRTLAALGLRAVTGQLTLLSDGKHFLVAFEHGAIVAAASPLASDAAVRVALTSHLVSSSQVPEISRRQAAAPERDEIDVIAELARLGPDHALRLRRRVIAQRAARTFSLNHGEFLVTDATELRVLAGCELDIRAIIYMGARANLSEQRLASELDQLGGWFRLKPALDDDLPQFGFTDVEQPVVERLRDGGTLAELEDFATSFVDARTVRAVVYALAAYNACEVGPAPPGSTARRADTSSPAHAATQPMPRITAPGAPLAHSVPRSVTQPIPRTVTPPGAPPRTTTPSGSSPRLVPPDAARTTTPSGATPRTVTPGARAAARQATGSQQTEPMSTFLASEGAALSGAARSIGPLPTEPISALSDDAGPGGRRGPARPPSESGAGLAGFGDGRLDPPTRRDPLEVAPASPHEPPRPRRPSELAAPRDGSSPGLSRPIEPAPRDRSTPNLSPPLEPGRRDRSTPNLSPPLEPGRRDRSSPGLPRALDDTRRPTPTLRFPTDDGGAGSSPALHYPSDPTSARDGSSPGLRYAGDDPRAPDGSSPGLRPPATSDDRDGSSPRLRRTDADARDGSSPRLRPPGTGDARDGSSPRLRTPAAVRPELPASADDEWDSLREPAADADDASSLEHPLQLETPTHRDISAMGYTIDDDAAPSAPSAPIAPGPRAADPAPDPAGAGFVIRRVAGARPPVARQVARSDSPHSHHVKALIAQRLKLLDQQADHFQLLGIPHDATPDALRKAYFALARQLHPDRLAALGISDDGKHAQRLFAQINAGFATLSDPARRDDYLSVLRRGGEAAIRAEQAKAEELASRIVDAEEAFHRGELALRRDQPQAAVVELTRAIQLNPEEADYHALLAWSQFCAAPDKLAVAPATRAALDKAIQRSPRAVTARFYLGRVERMLGRDQDALRHFREVLDAAPGHTEAAAELRVIESRLSGGDKPSGGGIFGRNKR